jgi:hypothetical protein
VAFQCLVHYRQLISVYYMTKISSHYSIIKATVIFMTLIFCYLPLILPHASTKKCFAFKIYFLSRYISFKIYLPTFQKDIVNIHSLKLTNSKIPVLVLSSHDLFH